MTKLAVAAIKQLQAENRDLMVKLASATETVKLAFELYHNGQISAEQLENKIKEFSTKSKEELEVIKKASEFSKTASNIGSFKLSNNSYGFDKTLPEDRFTAMLLEDT